MLGAIERVGNRLPHPLYLSLIMAALVAVGSTIAHAFGAQTMDPSTGEPRAVEGLLTRTLQERILTQRVDLATDGSLFTHAMALHLSVPLQELDRVAHRISRLSDTRLCAAVAGERHNLHVVMWLRSLSGAKAAEEAVLRDEEIRVRGRRIVLHHHKRLGHLFDDAGRCAGVVSWVPSGSIPRTRSR